MESGFLSCVSFEIADFSSRHQSFSYLFDGGRGLVCSERGGKRERRLEKWELTVHSSTTAMQSERAVLWYDQCTWCPTSYTARRSFGSQAPEAFAAHM